MGFEERQELTLYLRLPVKIIDAHQVLELHPKISIVHLPRQKSRRWCTIEFDNPTVLEEVRSALKKLKVNGKSVVVKPFRKSQRINKKAQNLSSTNLEKLLA